MKLQTRHFGEIEIDKSKIIVFNEGLLGLENLHKFILIEDHESDFCYLQSLEQGEIAFTIIDPMLIKKDYAPYINESYFEKIGGGAVEQFAIYNIITVRNPIEETTVNLQAPLLIHTTKRLGIQTIVEDKTYKIRHNLMELMKERN